MDDDARYKIYIPLFDSLLDIVTSAPQDSYIRLIVSSLDYSKEGNNRAVLSKALCTSAEVCVIR